MTHPGTEAAVEEKSVPEEPARSQRKRVGDRISFYMHLAVFIIVHVTVLTWILFASAGVAPGWFLPFYFWLLFLIMHCLAVSCFDHDISLDYTESEKLALLA